MGFLLQDSKHINNNSTRLADAKHHAHSQRPCDGCLHWLIWRAPEVSFGLEALPEGKLALPEEVVDCGQPAPEPRTGASA